MKHPQTKEQAVEFYKMKVRWGVPDHLGKSIIYFFYDLGAKHDMPSERSELVKYVNRYHKKMTIDNIHCPNDIPFDIIYSSFFTAVLNNDVELPEYQPHAVKNQLKAFKAWITKSNRLNKLREEYYRQYPQARPKQINETLKRKYQNEEDFVDQSPEDVKRQIEILSKIYGGWEKALDDVEGMKTYRHKLQRTYKNHQEKGYYGN